MGALKLGLKATLGNLRTVVHNCALLWPFCLSKGNFRRKMTTIVGNRGQLWTSALSPHLESPHLDFPECQRIAQFLVHSGMSWYSGLGLPGIPTEHDPPSNRGEVLVLPGTGSEDRAFGPLPEKA